MTDFYRWMEENRKRQGELTAIFEKQIEYIANANKRLRELEAENRALQGRVLRAARFAVETEGV